MNSDPIGAALDQLELLGAPLLVHSSMRSFGDRRHDAADVIIDACIGARTTLLVPSWTEQHFEIDPPPGATRPCRDASDVDTTLTNCASPHLADIYHPDCRLIDDNMGYLARAIIERPDRARGIHPLNSFAAVGPNADDLVQGQTYTDVYAPIDRLARLGGHILLIGIGLNRMTAFHLSEQNAGRELCIRWALDPSGQPCMVRTGGCSEGFPRLWPAVRSLASELDVHGSHWLSFRAHDVIQAATRAISSRTIDTACNTTCYRCAVTAASGPTTK